MSYANFKAAIVNVNAERGWCQYLDQLYRKACPTDFTDMWLADNLSFDNPSITMNTTLKPFSHF